MQSIGQIWDGFWLAFHTKKEKRLSAERDALAVKLQVARDEIIAFENENDKLIAAMGLLNETNAGLLDGQRKLQNAAITAADDIEVLNQRITLLRDGYNYNRGLVRTIISTTTNGFDDGGPAVGDTDAAARGSS